MFTFMLMALLSTETYIKDNIQLEVSTECISTSFEQNGMVGFSLLFFSGEFNASLHIDLYCTRETEDVSCRQVTIRIGNDRIELGIHNPIIIERLAEVNTLPDNTLMIRTTPNDTFYINGQEITFELSPTFEDTIETWNSICQPHDWDTSLETENRLMLQ